MKRPGILILDFGSQTTKLIARRVREANVYCEIRPYFEPPTEDEKDLILGLIFSGGPNSVYADGAPTLPASVMDYGVPILGICYGMQLITHLGGGVVEPATTREFGRAELHVTDTACPLLKDFDSEIVWMSHGDHISKLPTGFRSVAVSDGSPVCVMAREDNRVFGVQFHPEVSHTPHGTELIKNFVFDVCGAEADWTMNNFIDEACANIRKQVGDDHVILGLSGGVDSTVVAALLAKAIPGQTTAIFVDSGLMRHEEAEEVCAFFETFEGINFVPVHAGEQFLGELAGKTDPEEKRKTIGRVFIEVFDAEKSKVENAKWLAQGTLYPDVIESSSPAGGPSASIKSHHNVGGLPEEMEFELLEPLRELFKDEVRELGYALGLPHDRVGRHPFPGPGLAIRILGEVNEYSAGILRKADHIFISEIRDAGLYDEIWQAGVILLPVRSVGVMGDERTYEQAVALRAVTSRDGMTADWYPLPYDLMARISNRIINEVRGINRVCYDISSKPPATIEWE